MSHLSFVSYTGADDNTNVEALARFVEGNSPTPLSKNVEIALLYFPEKEGQNRNPTKNKRLEIIEALPRHNLAVHLCGEQVFRQILENDKDVFDELDQYSRIQLNINARKQLFTPQEVEDVYYTLWNRDYQLILQHHESTRFIVEDFAYSRFRTGYNVPHILFDTSRGKGIAPEIVPHPLPWLSCGYAGGLNKDNIATVRCDVEAIYQHIENSITSYIGEFWMDLETGARTNNEFDLDVCQQIQDAVSITK